MSLRLSDDSMLLMTTQEAGSTPVRAAMCVRVHVCRVTFAACRGRGGSKPGGALDFGSSRRLHLQQNQLRLGTLELWLTFKLFIYLF